MKLLILFLSSWILSGFIAFVYMLTVDLRGEEYDPEYFDKDLLYCFLIALLLGYLTPVFLLIDNQIEKQSLQKFIYKLANIGYKEDNFNMPNKKHKEGGENA